MNRKRTYYIIIGSKAYFDREVESVLKGEKADNFLELVKLSDAYRNSGKSKKITANNLVVYNNHYHGIVEAAHDRLGPLIEELTTDNATIFVHNPPKVLRDYIDEEYNRNLICRNFKNEEYYIERSKESFAERISEIEEAIIGQDEAVYEISKSLWYLTNSNRTKPYVIMLYGNSSIGKTELVREVAKHFFKGKMLEKHLSMFKNPIYSDYFFGESPNRRSLGYDLLERESNLIFFDELDKCPEHFYSAFYTLFDNTVFKDSTYDVDISGVIIVLTSNYHTESEIMSQLGLPIFYRIDKFIHFEDFNVDTVHRLVLKELRDRKDDFSMLCTEDEMYSVVSRKISTFGENARTIKYKIQKEIEESLFMDVANEKLTHKK